jgi:hypothetical protein
VPTAIQTTNTLGAVFSGYRHLNITQAESFYEGSGWKYFVGPQWIVWLLKLELVVE